MSDVGGLEEALRARARSECELCGAQSGPTANPTLGPVSVPPNPDSTIDRTVLLCETCSGQLDGTATMDAKHWRCLQGAAWSEVTAVQVVTYRLLSRLRDESWAQDLLQQIYLDEEALKWAEQGLGGDEESAAPTLDSNGARLSDGDSVTLIKDLAVKGAGFTAKRGTLVKNIRLTNNPEHVDGRVNKVAIVLKTCFLKQAT